MAEEPQQITKEPQGKAVQVQQITKEPQQIMKKTTRQTNTSATSNYKEPKESRSW